MQVDFAGGGQPGPLAAEWSADGMAALFDKVCVATAGQASAVKDASLELEMIDKSYDMPVGKKQEPWPLTIARGDGVVVSQAARFLSNDRQQCNATFYLSQPVGMGEVESALERAIGRPADNGSDRTKKNGKPNRYFSPEWSVASQDGSGSTITVGPIASLGGSERTGYQFSLLANKEDRK